MFNYFCGMRIFWLLILSFSTIIIACNSNKDKAAADETQQAAINELSQQIAQNPDSAGLRLKLVDLYDSIGNYSKAYVELDSLIRKDSANYGLWYRRGQVSQNAHDTTQALQSFTIAARIYPSSDALLSLANLYAELKDQRALLLTNEVKKVATDRELMANCYFIDGVYYARTKNKSLALTAFDKSIASNYTFMEAYVEKGLVYFDEGNYKPALEIFRFASTINNLYADAYYYMARCYEMMQQKDSAVLRFKQSLTLDKNLNESHAGLKRLGAE
jgi:tetratricopeptide (TPR) repeat protein